MGATSSKVEESSEGKEITENDTFSRLVDTGKEANGSKKGSDDHYPKEKENSGVLPMNRPNIRRISKAAEGEQIAAGWPAWLTAVAGEAINGWVPRRADTFEKIDKIGQGTYSNVYKARDTINGRVVALKKVRFDNVEPESVKFMAREILILRRLDHPNVIKLEGLITTRMSCSLYLIFECMEHDLTGISSLPGVKFTEPQVKCYMHQLLTGLEYCHNRGVLHRDVKCSNLLLDSHGRLKIADFGLSIFYDKHSNTPLTSHVVTLWYRPPELLLGEVNYGVAVDLWGTGCVLGELYAGKPIMTGKTETAFLWTAKSISTEFFYDALLSSKRNMQAQQNEHLQLDIFIAVEQLYRIFKLCGSPSDDYWRNLKLHNASVFKPFQPYNSHLAETFKDISPPAFGLLAKLLSFEPENRGSASTALQSEFFRTEPLACDLSSLTKYPPSKESDVRFQESEAYRSRIMGAPRCGNYVTRGLKNVQEPPPPEKKRNGAQQRLRKAMVGEIHSSESADAAHQAHYSSYNIDQILKEHDKKIQEYAERIRYEQRRGIKIQAEQTRIKAQYIPSAPVPVSVMNVDDLLEEHDRQIQESTQRLIQEKKRPYRLKL